MQCQHCKCREAVHDGSTYLINAVGEYWCGDCLEEGTRQAQAVTVWAEGEAARHPLS